MNLRSHERQQLLDMLPTAMEKQEELNDREGAETVSEALERIEDSGSLDMDEDAMKSVLMALSTPDVQQKHGKTRVMWLVKKLTYRALDGRPR